MAPDLSTSESQADEPASTPRPPSPANSNKRRRDGGHRSKSGCSQCRARKVKCDERPGECLTCSRLGFSCSFSSTTLSSNTDPAAVVDGGPPKKRVRRACVLCRAQKLRCSGDLPRCDRCSSKGLACTYQLKDHRINQEEPEPAADGHPLDSPGAQENTLPLATASPGQAPRQSESGLATPTQTPTVSCLPRGVDASKAIIQQHIDAFFQFVYPTSTFNFMHRGSFLRSWHNGKMSRSLLRTVVGVASRFMDLDHGPGRKWVTESEQEIVADLDLISIPKLQILLLLIFDRTSTAKFSAVWYLVSLAARIAHGLRFGQPTNAVPFTNQECRRRLMWCVFCLDKVTCMGMDRTTSYPPLCPRSFMGIQLPCDERSFELEFECETHSLEDLAGNRYENAPRLGATAYLVRIIDLWEQIQVFCHRTEQSRREILLRNGDAEFWRLEQELSELSTNLPPEMQDSERAVYIRANTPESNVYIMVQTWLHTCWCELTGIFLFSSSAANESSFHASVDFMTSCRRVLAQHSVALHQFWSRIQATQGLSRKFFVTDWNIAPCVYKNTEAFLYVWDAAPSLLPDSRATVESALRLNIDILASLKGVSEYIARWHARVIGLIMASAFSDIIGPEERSEEDPGQAPRPGCHLTMEDVLVSTRRHEDARFPRRAGFRVPKEPPSISRSSTALTGVEAASGNSLQPQGSSTDMMSMAGHASTPSLGHPLHAPPAFLGEQPALSTPWNTSEHVDSSQINFAANEDTMNAFYAQALYDDDGSVGFGISPGVLDSLIGPTMIADERMGFGAFT